MRRLSLFCLVLSLGLLSSCGDNATEETSKARLVKYMQIKSKQQNQAHTFIGKVIANTQAELSFEVPGKLVQLPVLEGNKIKKGEVVAVIDEKRYKHVVSEARAKYQLSLAQFKRAAALVKKDFVSKSEYDILKSKRDVAHANLETALRDLKDTKIHAPFNGVVAKVLVENHEYVPAKKTIMRLHNLSLVDVEIQIPEALAKRIDKEEKRQKRPVSATFQALPKEEIPLQLKEYSSIADAQTQTYRVVFTMTPPKSLNVLPGMSVNVHVKLPDFTHQNQGFYLIPSSSVFSGSNKSPHVWVIEQKSMLLKAQPIKTASIVGEKIKVISGLMPGDLIVTAGVHFLREKEKVRLFNASSNK